MSRVAITPRAIAWALCACMFLLVLAGPPGSDAGSRISAATKRIPLRMTVNSTVVYTNARGVSTEVGSMRSRAFGRGAVTVRFGGKEGAKVQAARLTIFTAEGVIRSRTQITRKTQPDGSIKGTGRGRIVGGTGRYDGARGSFAISQRVRIQEGAGPPPGVDPTTAPPAGQGGGPGGGETKFSLRGTLILRLG